AWKRLIISVHESQDNQGDSRINEKWCAVLSIIRSFAEHVPRDSLSCFRVRTPGCPDTHRTGVAAWASHASPAVRARTGTAEAGIQRLRCPDCPGRARSGNVSQHA